MHFHLRLWKQESNGSKGQFIDIDAKEIPSECSFLEMLDIVNNRLTT
jgi:succinate dehydrogenase / fumarate reductase iron-sulfur subunit